MNDFKLYLAGLNLAANTINAYVIAVKNYFLYFDEITKTNLLARKSELIEKFKAKTVNLKIQAINNYLVFIGKENLKIKAVKVQQRLFLENVISDSDYEFLKKKLKKEKNKQWYFVARFLAATGARISELIKLK